MFRFIYAAPSIPISLHPLSLSDLPLIRALDKIQEKKLISSLSHDLLYLVIDTHNTNGLGVMCFTSYLYLPPIQIPSRLNGSPGNTYLTMFSTTCYYSRYPPFSYFPLSRSYRAKRTPHTYFLASSPSLFMSSMQYVGRSDDIHFREARPSRFNSPHRIM